MRILIGSLLLVTLTAIVGLGWTLDRIFDRVATDAASDEIQIYQVAGSRLATLLDASPDPGRAIQEWPDEQDLSATIQQRADFPLPTSMQAGFDSGEALVLESDDGVTLNYLLPAHSKVLTLTPTAYNTESSSSVRLVFTLVFYTGILALLLLWLYPLVRRLARLRAAAKAFGGGHLDSRINTEGMSYISEIETEFNRMAERIETLVSDNKLLSSAVSHDLRTPLARLRFGIDTLADSRDPEAGKKYVQRLSNDISEMEHLVSSLLDFARLDHVLSGKQRDVMQLDTLVQECVELHQHESVTITLDMESGLTVRGHPDYFAMLLNNLLQNALKYARDAVTVSLFRHDDTLLLQVSDDGPGIPGPQQRNVLIPFTRGVEAELDCKRGGDKPGRAQGKGHGLGLAIVNRIAQWHGGSVVISTAPDLGGARLTVSFPDRPESQAG